MVAPARLPHIQPMPEPQATEGEPGVYVGYRQVYTPQGHFELVAANSDGMTSDATYESVDTPPSNPGSPPIYYPSGGDCPRSLPIQHPIHSLGLKRRSPGTDDAVYAGGFESSSSIHSSPPKRATRKSLLSGRPTRVLRLPRSRRRAKNDKDLLPDITGPLSELTKHMTHIPIRDMEAYVQRPILERRAEVARKKDRRVTRPMNSFMLYRSAYTARTKEFLHLRNHQEVSRSLGKSWGMETPAIRTKYEALANLEKDNHCIAHPDYKFAPRKDPNPKARRRETEDEDSLADLDDDEFASDPICRPFRFSGDSEVESNFDSRGSTPFEDAMHGLPMSGSILTWQATDPSQPDIGMMPPTGGHQYLQTSLHPVPTGAHVEDVCLRTSYASLPYTTSSELAGLPGTSHYELIQPQTPAISNADGQLDPRLLMHGCDSPTPTEAVPYQHSSYPVWQEPQGTHSYLPVPTSVPQSPTSYPMVSGPYHPGMQPLAAHGSFDGSREAGLGASDGSLEASWTFVPRTLEDDLKSHDDDDAYGM